MSDQYSRILSEIATNPWTALIITMDATVKDVIRLDSAPTAPLVMELTRANPGYAVHFFERKEIGEEELTKVIASAVEALKLDKAGKLKPGANIIK